MSKKKAKPKKTHRAGPPPGTKIMNWFRCHGCGQNEQRGVAARRCSKCGGALEKLPPVSTPKPPPPATRADFSDKQAASEPPIDQVKQVGEELAGTTDPATGLATPPRASRNDIPPDLPFPGSLLPPEWPQGEVKPADESANQGEAPSLLSFEELDANGKPVEGLTHAAPNPE